MSLPPNAYDDQLHSVPAINLHSRGLAIELDSLKKRISILIFLSNVILETIIILHSDAY